MARSSFLVTTAALVVVVVRLPSVTEGFATTTTVRMTPTPVAATTISARTITTTAFPKITMSAMATNDNEDNNEDGEKDDAVRDWDVDLYQTKHGFVWEYGTSLVDVLDPQPEDFILDVGCGSGELTGIIADSGADVIGIDVDPNMIEAATCNFPHLDFPCVDASKLLGNQEMASMVSRRYFDAVFSNAALHWVTDAEPAVIGMVSLLKPGGRFVVEFGGKGNVQSIVEACLEENPGATSPWYFPSIAEYSALLETHGIEVTYAALYDRPTKLQDGDEGMKRWLEMFGDGLFRGNDSQKQKEERIDAAVERLRNHTKLYDARDHEWTADYRRIRIVGKKVSQ